MKRNETTHAAKEILRRRCDALRDLLEAMDSIMRQNLRRRNPDASDVQIERQLTAWYLDKAMPEAPGLVPGDKSRFAT